MIVYWLMFFVAAIGALGTAGKNKVRSSIGVWLWIEILYIILIGFRMSGGDYYNYYRRFNEMAYLTLEEAMRTSDAGYQFISYYVYHWDLGYFTLSILCAIFSIAGLVVFLRKQINPWLGLAVAVPYLIIVVYMGYMRQGVALGFVMWGITALQHRKFIKYLIFVLLAITFHKSAIIMVAFGIFARERGRLIQLLGVIAAGAGIWFAFVGSGVKELWVNYVDAQMQSQGAIIRVSLNIVPALLLFYFREEWKRYFNDYRFWKMIALSSLASIGLVGFASTAVDRMALYFIPLQLVVYSRLPLLAKNKVSPKMTTFLVVLFYFAILFVWLNFAGHVKYWLPYRNFLFMNL